MTKERPILMSGEMVRAILDGRKTQTRRVIRKINGFREFFFDDDRKIIDAQSMLTRRGPNVIDSYGCPYGQVGDRLWIRETFTDDDWPADGGPNYHYRADMHEGELHWWSWKPSIFMPRRASRLTLEVTAVRVERLQAITDDDCYAEGIPAAGDALGNPRAPFRDLWDSINGKRAPWSSNPWVWCLSFKRLESTK